MRYLLLTCLISLLTSGVAPARSEILVGVPLPLSGPNSSLGAETQAGVLQAIDDLNDEGAFRPEHLSPVMLNDRCDDEGQGQTAKAVARELVEAKRVRVVIGHPCSGGAIPASLTYDEHRVPFLTYATKTELTKRGLRFVFRVAGTDDQQGEIAADYIATNYRSRKVAVLHDNHPYGQGLATKVQQRLHEHDIQVVMFQEIEPGTTGYLVSQMRNLGVQVIYYGGYPDVGGPLFRQSWAELSVPMLGGDGLASSDYWHQAGPEAAEHTLVTNPQDFSSRSSKAADVAQAIRARNTVFYPLSLYAYAAVQAWAQAYRQAGTPEGGEVARKLREGTFETVIGSIQFGEEGDLIGPTTFGWFTWHNGVLVPNDTRLPVPPSFPVSPPENSPKLVCRAQAGLKALRYGVSRIDGILGKQTKETLRAFGRARGLSVDPDHIHEQLVNRIEQTVGAEPDASAAGLAGWKYTGLVCRVQVGLNALGYPAGQTDGIAGRRTNGALEAFGRDRGIPIKLGYIDEQLVATIEQGL
jgi:branched-chain amino acid transport system substrate-binding protein